MAVLMKKDECFVSVEGGRVSYLNTESEVLDCLRDRLEPDEFAALTKRDRNYADRINRRLSDFGYGRVRKAYRPEPAVKAAPTFMPVKFRTWALMSGDDVVVINGRPKVSRYYSELIRYIQMNHEVSNAGKTSELSAHGYFHTSVRVAALIEEVPEGDNSHYIERAQFRKGR